MQSLTLNNDTKGKFIVFEGARGVGKSLHIDYLHKYFIEQNIKVIKTYEIGGTDLGNNIRDIILKQDFNIDNDINLLLILAARRHHVQKIQKYLDKGFIVLCDRFFYSTIIYQDLFNSIDEFLKLHNRFCYNLTPDHVFFLESDHNTLASRLISRNRPKDNHDFSADKMFKINQDYKKIYQYFSMDKNVHLVDANRDISCIQQEVKEKLNV